MPIVTTDEGRKINYKDDGEEILNRLLALRGGSVHMELMVAPLPIFDHYKEVRGYYFSYQVGNALIESGKSFLFEGRTSSPFFEFINEVGLTALTRGKMVFVPMTNVLLATNLEQACKVDPSFVVLLLGRKVHLSEENLRRVERLKGAGFKVAFWHFKDINRVKPFFPYTDYVFCGNDTREVMSTIKVIEESRYPIKVVASRIDTNSTFKRLTAFGVELFRGDFYKESTMVSENAPISPLKINCIRLLEQVSEDDFEYDKFAEAVQRDTALALKFLRMVNSSTVRENKIGSLKHAAAMLGQREIKKWVTTAVTHSMGQESPGEVVRLSLVRAKFCENLATLFGIKEDTDNLFLTGLFSVLDVILDMSMGRALEMVFVPDEVGEALKGVDNELGRVLQFVRSYERGDWTEVSRVALVSDIAITDIAGAYYDALTWYGRLVTTSMSSEGESE